MPGIEIERGVITKSTITYWNKLDLIFSYAYSVTLEVVNPESSRDLQPPE